MPSKIRLVHDDAHKLVKKVPVKPPKKTVEKTGACTPPKIVLDFSEKWMRPILKIDRSIINSDEKLDHETRSSDREEEAHIEDKPTSQVSSVKSDSKLS